MSASPAVFKLLDANTTVAYGPWIAIGNAVPDSVQLHVEGLTATDRVQVFQSSQTDPTTAEQVQFGSDIAADGLTEITTPSRWIRAYRSNISGAGTITATLTWIDLI